jgi:hypothetical protein
MRCLPLCEPDTFPVSFLIQTPPVPENASDSLNSRLRNNGVARNPWPSTAATAASSDATRSR